jgi:hypothetical protein
VKRKNGVEAAVATSESKKEDAPRSLISQVDVTSCAERNVPDNTLASHKRQNAEFRRANQVEVVFLFIAGRREGRAGLSKSVERNSVIMRHAVLFSTNSGE